MSLWGLSLRAALSVAALSFSIYALAQQPKPSGDGGLAPVSQLSAGAKPQEASAPTKPADIGGTPVLFAGKPLLRLRGSFGGLSLEARAKQIQARLEKIARDALTKVDQIKTADGKVTTNLVLGETLILSVTDADARPTGRTRQQLAADYARQVRLALREELKSTSLKNILLGILYTLLATAGLILVFKVMSRLFPKLYARIRSWEGTRIRAVRVQRVELLSAHRITELVVGTARLFRVGVVLLVLYFYIPTVLAFFPWTRGMADKLFGYIGSAVGSVWGGFVGYLPNIFYIAIIVIVVNYILKLIKFFAAEMDKGTISFPGFYREWAMPTYKIVRFMVMALGVVLIFPYLPGSKSPAFQGVSVFIGVLFTFGGAGAISNVVAGVLLTYMRPFKLGDRVKIASTVGDVLERNLLITRIRTIKNVDVTIPNAQVMGSHIINFSGSQEEYPLILNTKVTIGYDVPWRQVHELLISAALEVENIFHEPKPFVLQTSLDDFSVSYELNATTDSPNKAARTYASLHEKIQDKFNEAGVEIMSPRFHAIRDGNQVTIPTDHLPKDYEAPSFRLPLSHLFEARATGGKKDEPSSES